MAHSDTFPIEEPQASPLPLPNNPKAMALVSVNTGGSSRPGGPSRQNSAQTEYMSMLLAVDTVPRLQNILASFFTWILLAGFVIFPGTFTALQNINNTAINDNQTITTILSSFKNAPLLIIACVCCGIGVVGMLSLWRAWRKNYVWLLNSIFLPGCLNSLAGLISTVVNVYCQQNGTWSTMAMVSGIVTGSCMVICGILFGLYNFWLLEKVKKRRNRTIESLVETENETLRERVERKANEPALEFGSVV